MKKKIANKGFNGFSVTVGPYEIGLASLIFSYILVSSYGITLPFSYGHQGYIGAVQSTFAMNYQKFGYKGTKLGQIANYGSIETGKEEYSNYIKRPVGMALLVSLSFLLFGVHEWALRLVPILINTGTILLLYLFVKEYWRKRTALLSCFFLVFSPMFIFVRTFSAVEVLAVFFMLLMLYVYIKWLKRERTRNLYAMFIIFALGTLSDWVFYFILPAILIHYFLFVNRGKKDKKILYLIPLSILMFLFFIGHVRILTGSFGGGEGLGGDLIENLLFRLNLNENSNNYNITLWGLVEKFYVSFSQFYTKALIITSFLFALLFLKKIISKESIEKEVLPVLMFTSMLSFLFIFSNLFWIHGFLVLILNPSVAILAALAIENSWDLVKEKRMALKTVFLILLIVSLIITFQNFYTNGKQIYHDSSRVDPIFDFLSNNNEDIIISFYVNPEAYDSRFYLSQVKVKEISKKAELIDLLNMENSFRYVLVGKSVSKSLADYLTANFYKKNVGSFTAFDLTIPIFQSLPSESELHPKESVSAPKNSPLDKTPPRLVIFNPEEDTTLSNEIAINSVSDESCSFVYSWDGKGNITGPVGGYNLKVTQGEFTNDEDSNIVLELHMNEKRGTKIFDDSGIANHGTFNNGDWVSGKFGSATGYDGISSDIIVDDNPSLRISGSELTISSWVWIEDDSSWRPIVRKGTNGFLNYLLLITPDNKLGIRMDSVADIHIESNNPIPVNRWTHVAGVYNGTNLNLYINGELDASKNAEGDLISSNTQDLTVGREIDQNVWFSGYIDELIIWNRSLSTSEIKKVYSSALVTGDHFVDVYCKDSNNNWGHARKDYILRPDSHIG